ncbi:hypothetical protein LIER_04325 [Lithospermum erythrorhizon]|uniref:Uncharacterized protein n=1 Tax=Lithospermum erythrorhizon TaxID=34254 RepID=A0AAV3NY96_LITER
MQGLGFLTMSTAPFLANSTGTCSDYKPECVDNVQKTLLYTALPLMAIGMSGHMVSLIQFMGDQFQKSTPSITLDDLSTLFGIPAICVLVATIFFLNSSFSYVKKGPQGSPLTSMVRVIVGSVRNITKKLPDDPNDLYEIHNPNVVCLPHSRGLRCLDKAAIKLANQENENNRWKLCRVIEIGDINEILLLGQDVVQ